MKARGDLTYANEEKRYKDSDIADLKRQLAELTLDNQFKTDEKDKLQARDIQLSSQLVATADVLYGGPGLSQWCHIEALLCRKLTWPRVATPPPACGPAVRAERRECGTAAVNNLGAVWRDHFAALPQHRGRVKVLDHSDLIGRLHLTAWPGSGQLP